MTGDPNITSLSPTRSGDGKTSSDTTTQVTSPDSLGVTIDHSTPLVGGQAFQVTATIRNQSAHPICGIIASLEVRGQSLIPENSIDDTAVTQLQDQRNQLETRLTSIVIPILEDNEAQARYGRLWHLTRWLHHATSRIRRYFIFETLGATLLTRVSGLDDSNLASNVRAALSILDLDDLSRYQPMVDALDERSPVRLAFAADSARYLSVVTKLREAEQHGQYPGALLQPQGSMTVGFSCKARFYRNPQTESVRLAVTYRDGVAREPRRFAQTCQLSFRANTALLLGGAAIAGAAGLVIRAFLFSGTVRPSELWQRLLAVPLFSILVCLLCLRQNATQRNVLGVVVEDLWGAIVVGFLTGLFVDEILKKVGSSFELGK